MDDRSEDKLSQDIRRLMRQASEPRAVPAADDQPLLLTDPVDAGRGGSSSETPVQPFSPPVDRSIQGTLAKLAAREKARAEGDDKGVSVSTRSLDDVVMEALRPVLSEWLDANLERIVREQVDEALRAETDGK